MITLILETTCSTPVGCSRKKYPALRGEVTRREIYETKSLDMVMINYNFFDVAAAALGGEIITVKMEGGGGLHVFFFKD